MDVMKTLTDYRGTRHDVLESWEGAHIEWHRTGCGLTMPDDEMYASNYQDAYCKRCIEYKGHRARNEAQAETTALV